MDSLDLNLLLALDVLLAENSVTAAARRLGLSASAMSRTLTRLRTATGDPLLVRAGRSLVPTPHAAALRQPVARLAQEARAVLRPPASRLDLAGLEQCFCLRANDSFIERFGAELLAAIRAQAPRARLRFAPRPDKDSAPLRAGLIDLDIGVAEAPAPELCRALLFRDRYVGVAQAAHPLFESPDPTAERYAACEHVAVSLRGDFGGVVDDALREKGLHRQVPLVVPGFRQALGIAQQSQLVALVPQSCLSGLPKETAQEGLRAFELPVILPDFEVCALWHPRLDADPAQRWLRQLLFALCRVASDADGVRISGIPLAR